MVKIPITGFSEEDVSKFLVLILIKIFCLHLYQFGYKTEKISVSSHLRSWKLEYVWHFAE